MSIRGKFWPFEIDDFNSLNLDDLHSLKNYIDDRIEELNNMDRIKTCVNNNNYTYCCEDYGFIEGLQQLKVPYYALATKTSLEAKDDTILYTAWPYEQKDWVKRINPDEIYLLKNPDKAKFGQWQYDENKEIYYTRAEISVYFYYRSRHDLFEKSKEYPNNLEVSFIDQSGDVIEGNLKNGYLHVGYFKMGSPDEYILLLLERR